MLRASGKEADSIMATAFGSGGEVEMDWNSLSLSICPGPDKTVSCGTTKASSSRHPEILGLADKKHSTKSVLM